MPKKCAPCLEAGFKEALLREVQDTALRAALEQLPVCGLRKKSEYQLFTSQCLKGKHLTRFDPGALKDCARQWRERRGKQERHDG